MCPLWLRCTQGWPLLLALDAIQPGCVAWSRVFPLPFKEQVSICHTHAVCICSHAEDTGSVQASASRLKNSALDTGFDPVANNTCTLGSHHAPVFPLPHPRNTLAPAPATSPSPPFPRCMRSWPCATATSSWPCAAPGSCRWSTSAASTSRRAGAWRRCHWWGKGVGEGKVWAVLPAGFRGACVLCDLRHTMSTR